MTEEEVGESFNLFIDMSLMVANPALVKRGIDPLRTEEIQPLVDAMISLLSPKLAEAGEAVAEKIEKIAMLKKIFDFIRALYDIIEPRFKSIQKHFKNKKEERGQ